MKFIYLSICFILSGCIYQTANNVDIKKAIEFCKGAENIDTISINSFGNEKVVCLDGTFIFTDNYKIIKSTESIK